ncbi:lasso peptide biosynthesis B2 protein [Streptomyces sp. Wh19]|nr:lasso peptide biosynthesis B2 protein [Streptomyces sp. Wh19]MDV9201172.1 lasso peptide biosynthesis B2 protein [Streptomyces sp. Wh19]
MRRRAMAHACVAAARLLARAKPGRILHTIRRGAIPATYEQAAVRDDITGTSTLCAGTYCLQRSLATALLCRTRGVWPTWRTGVRTPPFTAHAWIEADGRPVSEPTDTATYYPMLTVPPAPSVTTR